MDSEEAHNVSLLPFPEKALRLLKQKDADVEPSESTTCRNTWWWRQLLLPTPLAVQQPCSIVFSDNEGLCEEQR